MGNLLRQPLAWMVAAELVVVAALVGVAWHVLQGSAATPGAALVLPTVSAPADAAATPDVPPDVLIPPSPSSIPLLPGLNVDPAFWRERLVALNAAEAQLEALEWRIVHSAMDTVRRYVESVVVPELEQAEAGHR